MDHINKENLKDEIVEIDISKKDLFNLMLIAHEKNITLNQLCNQILIDELERKNDENTSVLKQRDEKNINKSNGQGKYKILKKNGIIMPRSCKLDDYSMYLLHSNHQEFINALIDQNFILRVDEFGKEIDLLYSGHDKIQGNAENIIYFGFNDLLVLNNISEFDKQLEICNIDKYTDKYILVFHHDCSNNWLKYNFFDCSNTKDIKSLLNLLQNLHENKNEKRIIVINDVWNTYKNRKF